MISRHLASNRPLSMLFALVTLFLLAACGGGGGGGGGPASEENVTITGILDDGGGNAPIADAVCRFLLASGAQAHSDITDAGGAFQLVVAPDTRGHIVCSPRSAPNLSLSTFSSTQGYLAGERLDSENVTPATTVVADIIRYEDPPDPEARKIELLSDIVTKQNANLDIVVAMAERLYKAMLAQQINTSFGDDNDRNGADGGGSSGSDAGGASGDAGDGADFSPLPQATCEFVVGDNLTDGEPVSSAALADFIKDGLLNRPDLAAVAAEVNQGADPSEVKSAFAEFFPDGLGQPISTLTDDQGHYFLPIMPNIAGYIRCFPKDRTQLLVGTYFPGREVDQVVAGQDVNPASTLFSTDIAPVLNGDLAAVLENFKTDIEGLKVLLSGPNLPQGPLTAIALGTDTQPANSEVGLVAFAVTALFNAFNKNGLDVDFQAAIAQLRDTGGVTPAFLTAQGVPQDQSQGLADLINTAITAAAGTLGTDLATAWSTGRINVTVMDDVDGSLITDATLDIADTDLSCTGCGSQTDAQGQLTLAIGGLGQTATDVAVVVSGVPGFESATFTAQLAALATVDLEVRLSNPARDTQAPTVTITSPAGASITTSTGSLDIQGTAMDDAGVTAVSWSNDRGGSGTCEGTKSWSASGIVLQEGDNVITVTAVDVSGHQGDAVLVVTYEPLFQLIIQGSGSGSGFVFDNANLGIDCTIEAGSASGSCTGSFPGDTAVSLGFEPSGSAVLTAWSGPCSGTGSCNFSLTRNQTVTATIMRSCVQSDISITPGSAAIPEGGGPGSFNVTAPDDCVWTAFENEDWIALTHGSGIGDGTVNYQVTPNTGTATKTGLITVSGHSHSVSQTWSDFIADWNATDPQEGDIYRVLIEDNANSGVTVSPFYWCDGGPYCTVTPQTLEDPGAGPISFTYNIIGAGASETVTLTLQSPTALHALHLIRYVTGSGTIENEYNSDLVPQN